MENYLGLIIAVENYNDVKKIPKVQFANNDAEKVRESLIQLGCDTSKLELLSGAKATKTSIETKVKKVARSARKKDTILLYYAGHGFFENGQNRISSVDTELDSIESTTIPITSILSKFEDSESTRIIAFLDCCHSGIEFNENERSPLSEFSTDDLKYEYKETEHLIVFASCKSDEKSQADIERKHGAWSYYLIQALQGKAKDIYHKNLLFSNQLQKYLREKTFQRVKFITPEKKNQTPVKYGKETDDKFIVADLSRVFEAKKVAKSSKSLRLQEAIFSYSEEDSVRNLPGFKRGHTVPKIMNDYHENWIKKIAHNLIKEELDETRIVLKKVFKLKLKDIQETTIEDGYGQLSTIHFDYVVGVSQSKTHAGEYVLTRTIENFKNSDTVGSDEFNEAFDEEFDTLTLRVNKDIDIVELIEHIEEIDAPDNIDVDYSTSDLSKCTVTISGFEGVIHFEEDDIKIVVHKRTSPKALVDSFKGVYRELGSTGLKQLMK
ncbi:MAG: caspase family protein [Bacteroidota bacterium]